MREVVVAAARETLVRAVRLAGEIQLGARGHAKVSPKGTDDIVTDVDQRCEAEVSALLRASHPGHAMLGEERGADPSSTDGPLWILDPLDGTKNYAHGSPRFACALALAWEGEVRLGAVFAPAANELFVAERGKGATLNGNPLRVSVTADLSASLVSTAFTVHGRLCAHHFARLRALTEAAQGVRAGGCASLDLSDVARGRLDAYVEEGLEPWDTAAGALLVREAGGMTQDFAGLAHDPFRAEILASNGFVAGALLGLWREAAP
jgi:myo-inositol-1(or 4)-monophosphatase